MFVGASSLELPRVQALCEQFLLSRLSADNAVRLLRIAAEHGTSSLKSACLNFICGHSAEVKKTTSFRELLEEPHLLLELIMKLPKA